MIEKYQDSIDDYLLNRMSEEERNVFEEDCAKDAELKEQLDFTEKVRRVLKSRYDMLAKMEEWKKAYEQEEEQVAAADFRPTGSECAACPPSSKDFQLSEVKRGYGANRRFLVKRVLYWTSGIAAVFVAGLFLFKTLYFANRDTGGLSSPMEHVTVRSGTDYKDIVSLISQEKYEEALDMMGGKSMALKKDSLELALDANVDEEKREYGLQLVRDRLEDLKWLKVHALIGLHRQDEALSLLEALRASDGYYRLPADSLYHSLTK